MRELTEKQAYWQAHLHALEKFEGTAVDYAREHKLDVHQLYAYKKRLKEGTVSAVRAARFVPVTGPSMSRPGGIVVALPNGVRLALPNLDTPGLLERLARL